MTNTVDPVGGSHAIEELTDSIEREAEAYIARIDALGGMLRAIESGYVQSEIQESAYRHQRSVEKGETVVVGVNRFRMDEPAAIPTFRLDPEAERKQVERLRDLRASRDQALTQDRLDRLKQAARGSDNLMPFILDAAEALATVGEISDRLRAVFGEYREARA